MATKEKLIAYANGLEGTTEMAWRSAIDAITFSGPDNSCENDVALQAFEKVELASEFRKFLATLIVQPQNHKQPAPASDAVFWQG